MTAHDSQGRAHDSSRAPGSSRFTTIVNVDESGFSMSWKTGASVCAAVVLGVVAAVGFAGELARGVDLVAHQSKAHALVPIERDEVIEMVEPIKSKQVAIKTKLDAVEVTVISVQNGYYDQRAEDLAFKAVEKMPARAPSRQRIERFERVRRQAKQNLKAGRDIRADIHGPLL